MGRSFLEIVDNRAQELQLFEERYGFLLIIIDHARGVPELNHEDVLSNAPFERGPSQFDEEGDVLADVADPGELLLKPLPYLGGIPALGLHRSEQDLVAEVVVEGLGV